MYSGRRYFADQLHVSVLYTGHHQVGIINLIGNYTNVQPDDVLYTGPKHVVGQRSTIFRCTYIFYIYNIRIYLCF